MRARGHAKVNLGLEVLGRTDSGLHRLRSLAQSITLADDLTLSPAAEDSQSGLVAHPAHDLAWRAVLAVRAATGNTRPMRLELTKRTPVAAGLGGGSADAAAALVLAGHVLGAPPELATDLAPDLGSDVPFCLVGGTAVIADVGGAVTPMEHAGGYALALVVPPVELATAAVYAAWDRLDGRRGHEVPVGALPPSLRQHAPLRNDLYPAAVSLAPLVDEWRNELASRWGQPVVMTGSGPTLMSFFPDVAEAEGAIGDVPVGARFVGAVTPHRRGVSVDTG